MSQFSQAGDDVRLGRTCYGYLGVSTIEITVNGTPRQVRSGITVADLIAELGFAGRPVAVERNREVVPRKAHPETRLAAGDRLELVTFVGGG